MDTELDNLKYFLTFTKHIAFRRNSHKITLSQKVDPLPILPSLPPLYKILTLICTKKIRQPLESPVTIITFPFNFAFDLQTPHFEARHRLKRYNPTAIAPTDVTATVEIVIFWYFRLP